MVRSALTEVQKTSPQVVRSIKKIIGAAYEWGREHFPGIIFNPAQGIKVTVSKGKRDRWLVDSELSRLLPALDKLMDQESADCIRLVLFSACRPGEAYNLRASDIVTINGEKVWRMEDSKNGKEFLIPIQGRIKDVIDGRGIQLGPLFPMLAGKTNYPNRLKAAMRHLRNILDIPYFTPHDLRRTCRTHFSILGTLDYVAEAVLNHAKEEMAATYNLYSFWKERKVALETWHNKLSSLEAEEEEKVA
jgi:integrase